MSIQMIVHQALQDGYLTPTMEAEVGRICESASELSLEEYTALDQLMAALLAGQVVAMPHKQFINVMEELVVTEVITQVSELDDEQSKALDIADVAAYALNRLPPLYATSEEGAHYQRERAQNELHALIHKQSQEGIKRFLDRPQLPDRNPLDLPVRKDLLEQMNELLKTYAPD
ncbi:late competence development ComFB family protein [Synechocystis sp. LKSZ1]|uniref:late competence development ComFB family protein n=1 Tax=Synechocystis sp. LKSZ1 TaxID=3144951 RepID=UPI00336C196D